MSILLIVNHSLHHATQLMKQGLNDQMHLFRVFNYRKNLSRKRTMQNIQKMRGPKCLFHGRVINGYRLQFCYLKRFVNFDQNKAFPIFSPKDVPKMMWRIAQVDNVLLVKDSKFSVEIFSQTNFWKCSRSYFKDL